MLNLRELPQQVRKLWATLDRRTRIGIGAALFLSLAGLVLLLSTSAKPDYAPLYSSLSQEDAAQVVDKLREQHIPYQVAAGGDMIEIPRAQIAETRLSLASQGLPRGGGMGYELFDKQGLGVSEFTQHVNYHRALQGELERSIATLHAVQRARVHLVVPEKSLFRTASEQASASVVLALRPGQSLMPQQVQGIVHLIASSVEGLQPARVTVVDQHGEVLSQKSGTEGAATAQLAYQREIEKTAATRAQELLEKTLGRGHAAVQVNAQVDPSQTERTHEEFNPDQQVVRSEQEVEDVVGPGGESTGGVAGARANLPGGPPPQASPQQGSRRHSQTRNYEIGKVVRKITEPVGRLERLTVAVLVDGTYTPDPKDAHAPPKYVSRTKEELEAYAAIVREAVGFDEKRGDQLEVRSVPFATEAGDGQMTEVKEAVPPWAYAAAALALLLLGAMLAQLLVRRRRDVVTLLPHGLQLPTSVQQLQAGLAPHALGDGKTDEEHEAEDDLRMAAVKKSRQQAVEMITAQPDRAVQVLRAWLNDADSKREENEIPVGHLPPGNIQEDHRGSERA